VNLCFSGEERTFQRKLNFGLLTTVIGYPTSGFRLMLINYGNDVDV